MLSLDGAAHQQHRTPFERPFRKPTVHNRFTHPVRQQIEQHLSKLTPQGEAELRRDYAGPIAVQTMITALGLEAVPIAKVLCWYDTIVEAVTRVSAGEPVSEVGKAAFAALRQHLLPSLRQPPEANLLAQASGAANNLSDDEIISNAAVLLFGGIETTEGMITNAFFHLLTNPTVLQTVREELGMMTAVIEESLRLEPAAAVVDRYAVADVTLGSAQIKAGDLVRVSLLAANRDPDIFPQPDRFDPTRNNLQSHVAFAQGPHVCLGLHLARLETELALSQTITRLPNLQLKSDESAQADAQPRGLIFRKPKALHVFW